MVTLSNDFIYTVWKKLLVFLAIDICGVYNYLLLSAYHFPTAYFLPHSADCFYQDDHMIIDLSRKYSNVYLVGREVYILLGFLYILALLTIVNC